jgi:hypothetical protein
MPPPAKRAPVDLTPAPRHREQHYAIGLLVAAAQRGQPIGDVDTDDFTDPSARALILRILEITRSEARADWRPDLLELIDVPWLEEPIALVRESMVDIERLTDAQVVAQMQTAARQLRAARLSAELTELAVLAQEADEDALVQIKERIGRIASELADLRRGTNGSARGPSALGTLPPIVPPRFRGVDLSTPTPPPAIIRPVEDPAGPIPEPPEEPPFEPLGVDDELAYDFDDDSEPPA